jgi:hypothetical protein
VIERIKVGSSFTDVTQAETVRERLYDATVNVRALTEVHSPTKDDLYFRNGLSGQRNTQADQSTDQNRNEFHDRFSLNPTSRLLQPLVLIQRNNGFTSDNSRRVIASGSVGKWPDEDEKPIRELSRCGVPARIHPMEQLPSE